MLYLCCEQQENLWLPWCPRPQGCWGRLCIDFIKIKPCSWQKSDTVHFVNQGESKLHTNCLPHTAEIDSVHYCCARYHRTWCRPPCSLYTVHCTALQSTHCPGALPRYWDQHMVWLHRICTYSQTFASPTLPFLNIGNPNMLEWGVPAVHHHHWLGWKWQWWSYRNCHMQRSEHEHDQGWWVSMLGQGCSVNSVPNHHWLRWIK